MGTSVTGERCSGIRLDLNRDLVRLGASLGCNDVTIQTERATVAKLEDLRRWADETGNFKFIKDQGMTISVWVHEFCELPTDIGKPTMAIHLGRIPGAPSRVRSPSRRMRRRRRSTTNEG
jgi:hypothetical protein